MTDRTTTNGTAGQPVGRIPSAPTTMKPRRRARWRWLWGVLVLTALGLGGALWYAGSKPSVHYTTAPVTRGTVARAVTATGTINPVLTIIVGTAVSGVIQSLQCDYNTKVIQGQICAKIDPRSFQAVVDQDKANLAVAKAQLAKDQANLEYTKLNSGRTALLARENSIAQDTADLSRSAYHQGEAQVLLDQAAIQQWTAQLASAEVNLDYTDIVSPVNGTVVSRNVTEGQTVAASLQTPTLFLIATDLTKMEVDTNVSESDIGSVTEGNPASFTVEAYPERSFAGSVVQVRQAPQTLQNVVTFDVIVAVANPDLVLMPGMTATTRIVTAEHDNVVRVLDQALRYVPAGAAATPPAKPAPAAAPAPAVPAAVPAQPVAAAVPPPTAQAAAPAPGAPATVPAPPAAAATQGQVWVLANGKPVRVAVTLGLDDDTYTEIVGGELKPGDQVILSEQAGASGTPAVPLPHL